MRPRLVATLIFLLAGPGLAPPTDDADEEKLRAVEATAMSLHRAEAYAFRPAAGGDAFVRRPDPILKWTQPVYGSVYGSVFVWTAGGRPEVIASLLKWYRPFTHVTDEFHSLATRGIAADFEGQPAWTSEKPGVEPKPIPGAPDPARTPAGRLRQMRDLAQGFAGRQTDRQRDDREMRLLPQPLLRYEPTGGDVADGALFAFAHGTDPDAILLIEARPDAGVPRWHYALARMTTSALRISYRGQEVWNVPLLAYKEVYGHKEPYTSFRFDDARATPPPRAGQP